MERRASLLMKDVAESSHPEFLDEIEDASRIPSPASNTPQVNGS